MYFKKLSDKNYFLKTQTMKATSEGKYKLKLSE